MRRATRADIPAIVALLRDHHTEQAFAFPFDPALVSVDVAAAIADERWLCLVSERCVLLARCFRPPFVPVLIATEIMLRCERPGVRKLFVEEFEAWARARGCSMAALATTHSAPAFGRLYRRNGYAQAEVTFAKVL